MLWGSKHALAFKGLAVLLAGLVTLVLSILLPQAFESFDERSDSLTWNLPHSYEPERRVVVVDIDEKSVQALGAWPWSRKRMAELVTSLNDYGVGLKLFDIVMPDGKEGDAELKAALTQGAPSVGGQIFSIDPRVLVQSGTLSGAQAGVGPCPASSQAAFGYIGNEASIAQSFAATGHLTPIIDGDGAVRKVPAWVCFNGQSYPALSVAAMMQLGSMESAVKSAGKLSAKGSGASGMAPWWIKGRGLGDAPWTLKFKNLPDFALPLNAQGQIRVSYRTPRHEFISVSALDVIEHRVPKDMLGGVWALVGSTAFGAGDAIPTPHGGAEGGLEVHAQLMAAALDDATPYTPIGVGVFSMLWVVIGVVLLVSLSFVTKPSPITAAQGKPVKWHQREGAVFTLPILGALLVLASYALHAYGLLALHLWWNWSLCATSLALSALVLASADLAQLRWQRTRLYENLSSYLSGSAAEDVALSASSDEVSAHELAVTVMSINLRNFDRFCASQDHSLSARLLHDYLGLLNDIVQKAGGELQHVQGSEVLAVWRQAPNANDVDPDQLVMVSQTLWKQSQAWLKAWGQEHEVNVMLSSSELSFEDFESPSLQDPIRLGAELELEIGIEEGLALVGSLGPKERRVYTVLGEPVQVAQSLRGMCSELAYPVLLGPVFGAQFGLHHPSAGAAVSTTSTAASSLGYKAVLSLQPSLSQGAGSASKLTQAVHMTPINLGEFLLPGTTSARRVFAMPVELNPSRIHLVETWTTDQRVA